MKKILAFLGVLALLVSFGMAFSVTGEFFSKFAANNDNDSWMQLNFDAFSFKYAFDGDTYYTAPTTEMKAVLTGASLMPAAAWTEQRFGWMDFTGFKASDTLTVGAKIGMAGYGYHEVAQGTNAGGTSGLTNAGDIGFLSVKVGPHISFALSDTMTISDKDLQFQYWSMNQKYSDNAGLTNDRGADNALSSIGIGAQVSINLSDTLNINPGASFTIGELDYHDTTPSAGNTNIYKKGDNALKIYGIATLTGDMYKFKIYPYFQMDMKNWNNITTSTVTNTVVGSQMMVRAYLGDGKPTRNTDGDYSLGDGDSKYDKGDDKNIRMLKLSDQFTINPYFGVQTILASAYVDASSSGVTNNYANNEMVLAIGANDITYKIDDTYTIDGQVAYVMDNRGTANNINSPTGTNTYQTNVTTMSFGGKIKVQIAPNAVIHAGTTFTGWTKVLDIKDPASQTNVITINHSSLSDPTLELGGEVTVGDFAIKGVIKTSVKISASSDSTNMAPTSGTSDGGNVLISTQGFAESYGDMQLTYTKDNGKFKLKFQTGTKEAAPVVGAEVGYKF